MPLFVPRIVFSILPCIPSTAQRSMCELIFGKDQRDKNWPFTTSHKDVAVSIQHRHRSNVARSCRTTRHSPFLTPAMLPLTLLFNHPRRAERSMNGLNQWTCAQSLLNIVLGLSPRRRRNRISQSVATHDCRRDTIRGGAGAHGRATPLRGRRLFSWHGRVALRDTTVRDATWHGVSGRGASEACWQVSAQRGLQCGFYRVNGQACRADLFAGHPAPLELDEKRAGVGSAVGHWIAWHQGTVIRVAQQWSVSG